jgi:anti-anti-sigma factor
VEACCVYLIAVHLRTPGTKNAQAGTLRILARHDFPLHFQAYRSQGSLAPGVQQGTADGHERKALNAQGRGDRAREVKMNDLRFDTTVRVASETTEIVRGQEDKFLGQLEPMVRTHSIELDMSQVERIDAAGIAALIRLYCDAVQAGRQFSVLNPQPHVHEIMSIVGIDRVLMAASSEGARGDALGMELSAA